MNIKKIKEEKICDVCQSSDFFEFLKAKSLDDLASGEYTYLRCKRCGFVCLNNISDLNNSYSFDIYDESGYYSRKKERL